MNKNEKELDKNNVNHSIFLIEKIWLDSMENQVGNAVGYSPFGYVNTEEKAKEFCNKGKVYTKKDCWAVLGEINEYKYTEVKYLG